MRNAIREFARIMSIEPRITAKRINSQLNRAIDVLRALSKQDTTPDMRTQEQNLSATKNMISTDGGSD